MSLMAGKRRIMRSDGSLKGTLSNRAPPSDAVPLPAASWQFPWQPQIAQIVGSVGRDSWELVRQASRDSLDVRAPPGLHLAPPMGQYRSTPPGLHKAAAQEEDDEEQDEEEEEEGKKMGIWMELSMSRRRAADGCVTTLFLQNVHRRLVQEDAMQYWPQHIYKYDLFHVAFDLARGRGSGRVVINFPTPTHAAAFRSLWHGHIDEDLSGRDSQGKRKAILVKEGRRQGLYRNVAHWQRRLDPKGPAEYFPAVFSGGERISFWDCGQPRVQ